ncbi:YbjN domain-containing protein [Rhodovulum sp. DZ06]|uniref:YbjN domain-containing protein n=1 Tax=Rhodovulum sp. DZ06 TaxID=3425126 RepID=UPI003D3306B4
MRLSFAAPAAVALLLSAPAAAEDLFTPQNSMNILRFLKDDGYKATMDVDASGRPKISSSAEGVNFTVFFYDCTDKTDCRSIQFHAGFNKRDPMTTAEMNAWNRSKRYARAYVTDDGDPIIKMDINMDYGVSRRNFGDTFHIWRLLLADFKKHIDW